MKALVIDHVSKLIGEGLIRYGMEVEYRILPTTEELAAVIGDYDLLVMRVDPFIDQRVIDAVQKLRAIAVCSVGTNHIDLKYAEKAGIKVFNAPGLNSNAVAELTIARLIDLSRMVVAANLEVKSGTWNKYKWLGWELKGKTLGIIGYGKIGSRVGHFARAFEMETLVCDPYLDPRAIEKSGATPVGFDDLIRRSDMITIHTPLTNETRGMIGEKQFAAMKDGTILVNLARGGIVDETAAYRALQSGRLGGFGSDVLSDELAGGGLGEEARLTSPLYEFPNFIVTPHIGGGTHDAYDAIAGLILQRVAELFGF